MAQLECTNIRAEIERRLLEKDEEFESIRRNNQKIIESMQTSLDAEMKSKSDLVRQKKKLEGDINQLEATLDQTNRQLAEIQKANKRLSIQVTELVAQLEDEKTQKGELREQLLVVERRMQTCADDLEYARSTMETNEKGKRVLEQEMHEAVDRIAELKASCANAIAAKRQVETSVGILKAEYDDAMSELKVSEEKARKYVTDCGRVVEELKAEQVWFGSEFECVYRGVSKKSYYFEH